jgi:hypothetical protein
MVAAEDPQQAANCRLKRIGHGQGLRPGGQVSLDGELVQQDGRWLI